MTIHALIVDDEPLARTRLRKLLEQEEGLALAGEAENVAEAAELAAATGPDVIFLDVRMPKGSGLELIAALSPRPSIIFTTAYPEFAVDAFDANAVDYLVKPISAERLARALNRLRATFARRTTAPPPPRGADRVAVRNRGEVLFLDTSEIYWVGAEGNYSRVHTREKSFLMRELIHSVAERLDPSVFVRVHRSALVNIGCVRKLVSNRDDGPMLVLTNGASVRVAASYREELERLLGGPF